MTDTSTIPEPAVQEEDRWKAAVREILAGSIIRTLLSILVGFFAGAVLIVLTNDDVIDASGYFFARPGDTIGAALNAVGDGYAALFRGAIYNVRADDFLTGIAPFFNTLTYAGPLIAAALGIALGFRVGLFNIGGQGQLIMGAAAAALVSIWVDAPGVLHLLLALVAGVFAASLWGAIVGLLKARTGAHEVIVTIMLNYIGLYLVSYLMRTPVLQDPNSGGNPITPRMDEDTVLPRLLGEGYSLHLGFLLAIVAAVFYWWLMERSKLGYRFRAVGLNAHAARTAGMNVNRLYVSAMALSAAFVGIAGVNQSLGSAAGITPSVDSGIGFDAITVALLGGSTAGGIVLAGILFGAMRAGGPAMQVADVPPEVLGVVQGLIVLFVAAPPLVRAMFRLPAPRRVTTAGRPKRKLPARSFRKERSE